MKKLLKLIFVVSLLIPLNIYAYSNKVIVGGETIGIEVKSNGVYIVGFYEVNKGLIAKNAGFKVGDIIKAVNNIDISSISDLNNIIDEVGVYTFKVNRNDKMLDIDIKLEEEDNIIKTGLYVKDTINGVGTLSYIDPETKIFGSLGHEILESSSLSRFEINDGNIYKAEVSSIKKSIDNLTGEKNADIDRNKIEGDVILNEITGIYGNYNDEYDDRELIDVGSSKDIKKGHALIKTVVFGDVVKDYDINIIAVDESDNTKNILFEIVDNELINETGGIVQGMSGSPIIQNDKIIGVVNYVIVDDVTKGYGIFITTMLEEGDKILLSK